MVVPLVRSPGSGRLVRVAPWPAPTRLEPVRVQDAEGGVLDLCPLEHAPAPGREVEPAVLRPEEWVCRRCASSLRLLLEGLPALLVDLEVARTRQARMGSGGGGRSSSTPLPWGERAADADFVLRETVRANLAWVLGVRGHVAPLSWAGVGQYLVAAVSWVVAHPDGPQVVDELLVALRHARRAVDRPADREFVGRCGGTTPLGERCTEALYCLPGAAEVDCPRCGWVWQVGERHQRMLGVLADELLPASAAARAATALGVRVAESTVRTWRRRGVLAPAVDERGNPRADRAGRPLYRVGDVVDLAGREDGAAGG